MDKYQVVEIVHKNQQEEHIIQQSNQQLFLLKVYHKHLTSLDQLLAMTQLKLQSKLLHPNILQLVEAFKFNGKAHLRYQFMQSSLRDVLNIGCKLSFMQIRNIIFQVLHGVHHAHSHAVFHGFLSPASLLYDGQMLKIDNFGSKLERAGEELLSYSAPQVLMGLQEPSQKADIFSIGCIFVQFLLGYSVFSGTSSKEVLLKQIKVLGTPSPKEWPLGNQLLNSKKLTRISKQQ